MAPHGRVVNVAPQQARDRRRGAEGDGLAAVVSAREAGLAGVADDVGLDGDAVANFEGGDGGVRGDDEARGFVAEDVRVFDDHGADGAVAPEVDVGAGVVEEVVSGVEVGVVVSGELECGKALGLVDIV